MRSKNVRRAAARIATDAHMALPPGAVRLPDNDQWTNRFEIESETSGRKYTIAQHRAKGHWGCSCPAWRNRRECKHLRNLGLPGAEEPSPIAALAGRIAGHGREMHPALQDIYRATERARMLSGLTDMDEDMLSKLIGVFDHTEGARLPDLSPPPAQVREAAPGQ